MWHHPDFALSDYSTLPPFPLPRLPIGSLRSQIFFRPRRFFLLFLPMRSLVLGYWDFDSLSFKIVQNFSVIISWKAALTANVHHICYKLSCMSGQTLCISFSGKERGSKEVSVCFSIVAKVAFLPLYFWKETYTQLSLNRDTSIRQTPGVGSCRFFVIFLYLYSLRTHTPLKRTTDTFEAVNGHLRNVLLSENTSKIHQNSIP